MKIITLITLVLLTQSVHAVELHTGLNGAWYNPEQSGQGFVMHVIPGSNLIFITWFTYDEQDGTQQWMTAQGTLESNPINLEISKFTDGVLNARPPIPQQSIWGTGSVEFISCTSAKFVFNGVVSGSINLVRISQPINCSET